MKEVRPFVFLLMFRVYTQFITGGERDIIKNHIQESKAVDYKWNHYRFLNAVRRQQLLKCVHFYFERVDILIVIV